MVVKYKRKRRIWMTIVSILVILFALFSVLDFIINKSRFMLLLSFGFQVVFWLGMVYFQAARYDDEKIIAQFGWPRINYENITSVKSKWGDIVISSEKREITINKDLVERESLKDFIDHLDQKTSKPLNTSILA